MLDYMLSSDLLLFLYLYIDKHWINILHNWGQMLISNVQIKRKTKKKFPTNTDNFVKMDQL